MATIDYDRQATISWLNRPHGDGLHGIPLEEHFDELTLKEAISFAIDHLDIERRKSVTIKCGIEKYNMFDIEEIYRRVDFPRS
jgi:hypothetical protein